MKRSAALSILIGILAATLAAPVHAEDDVLTRLQALSEQEQAEAAAPAELAEGPSTVVEVAGETEVDQDVDTEQGATHEERLDNYVKKLETEAKSEKGIVTARAKLAIALQRLGKHGNARQVLEQALQEEPKAQAMYDTLAKSLAKSDPGLTVYVGGKLTKFLVQPVIKNGRALVPIREVAELLGAKVSWDEATKTATIILGPNKVEVTRGSAKAKVNGREKALEVAATIIDGRTMLPLRFVSEALDQQVDYHPGEAGSAVISVVQK